MTSFRTACAAAIFAIATAWSSGQATAASAVVPFASEFAPGTILVRTEERALYLVMENGLARRYVVGVGATGWQWAGTTAIDGKFIAPNWMPPPEIRREQPGLPTIIAGGSPANPMGAAAMTLSGGGNYAIHGTNVPGSIGGFVSHGCIRMLNEDVLDLFARVVVGTVVVVLP
ncbi:MAG: L,D-transpeptidase [Bauldia sp.]|nr:L,D-transpeptidase [Bauldia sp.]MCW5719259.1 L,D-transpeptidase [Bauldia sp.]